MTKSIKSAQALWGALNEFETALKTSGIALPDPASAALGKLKKTVTGTTSLLLDNGEAEMRAAVETVKAKIAGQALA